MEANISMFSKFSTKDIEQNNYFDIMIAVKYWKRIDGSRLTKLRSCFCLTKFYQLVLASALPLTDEGKESFSDDQQKIILKNSSFPLHDKNGEETREKFTFMTKKDFSSPKKTKDEKLIEKKDSRVENSTLYERTQMTDDQMAFRSSQITSNCETRNLVTNNSQLNSISPSTTSSCTSLLTSSLLTKLISSTSEGLAHTSSLQSCQTVSSTSTSLTSTTTNHIGSELTDFVDLRSTSTSSGTLLGTTANSSSSSIIKTSSDALAYASSTSFIQFPYIASSQIKILTSSSSTKSRDSSFLLTPSKSCKIQHSSTPESNILSDVTCSIASQFTDKISPTKQNGMASYLQNSHFTSHEWNTNAFSLYKCTEPSASNEKIPTSTCNVTSSVPNSIMSNVANVITSCKKPIMSSSLDCSSVPYSHQMPLTVAVPSSFSSCSMCFGSSHSFSDCSSLTSSLSRTPELSPPVRTPDNVRNYGYVGEFVRQISNAHRLSLQENQNFTQVLR